MTGKKQIRYRRDLNQIIDLKLPAVELGCAEGFFSADMLSWGLKKLYMVDTWATISGAFGDGSSPQEWHDKNYQDAMDRVSKFKKKAVVLRGKTVDMAVRVPDNSIGLLYLDAGHDYQSVMDDLFTWFPKVVDGGVIAGHDYMNPAYGVYKAVNEFAQGITKEVYLIPEDKNEDAGFYFYK